MLLHHVARIAFWVAVCVLAIDTYQVFFHHGIPNMRTAPALRKKIVEFLKKDRAERKLTSYTVVDLGSGNGLLTREIARALPEAKVIGIEIAPQSVAWSNWMKRFNRLDNLEYRRMSFFDYDFSEPDAVVAYLLPVALGPLARKMRDEGRSGMLVAVNRWTLNNGWIPEQSLRIPTLYINQRSLHLYRKP
jgi:SAM-dependent methyltransferase